MSRATLSVRHLPQRERLRVEGEEAIIAIFTQAATLLSSSAGRRDVTGAHLGWGPIALGHTLPFPPALWINCAVDTSLCQRGQR